MRVSSVGIEVWGEDVRCRDEGVLRIYRARTFVPGSGALSRAAPDVVGFVGQDCSARLPTPNLTLKPPNLGFVDPGVRGL